MREVPTSIIQELIANELRPFWLLEFTVNGTDYEITNCDVPIAAGGNLYNPRGFKMPTLNYGDQQMVSQIALSIDNLDGYYTSDFVGGTPQGADLFLKQILLDSSFKPIGEVTGPIGYWKFNDGFGATLVDISGNGFDGTIVNAPSWVSGLQGFALDFNGSTQYVDVGDNFAAVTKAGTYAISVWFKIAAGELGADTYDGTLINISPGGASADRNGINIVNDTLQCCYYNGATYTGKTFHLSEVDDDKYNNVIMINNGGTVTAYLNGVEITSTGGSGLNQENRIAQNSTAYFDGIIDEVSIYNRILTTAEVADIYNNGVPGYVGPGVLTVFEGIIDAWTIDDRILKVTAKSEMSKWTQRPLSLHSVSCRWKDFKGTECGYAGAATWCDRTYSRCETLVNTVNFGGFRWLPSIMDKVFWWGKSPAE
jgi:hypothetical protein